MSETVIKYDEAVEGGTHDVIIRDADGEIVVLISLFENGYVSLDVYRDEVAGCVFTKSEEGFINGRMEISIPEGGAGGKFINLNWEQPR